LGSASLDLLQQSGETLAGRIAYLELGALNVLETGAEQLDNLWLRGGFPESLTALNDARSLRWRQNFIRTYLERDIPQFGPRIAADTLRRFWTMLAHHQSGMLNVTQLARNIGVDVKTAQSYIDLLCDLLLVRRLPPWHANIGKRLVKTPKVYVRDCGLVHALLDIGTKEALLSHMVLGASWEGFVIENLLSCAPATVQGYFYRTSGGAEVDLVLVWPGNEIWAIEVKRSLTPKVERGFHAACADLLPTRKIVVYPGKEPFPMDHGVQAMPLGTLCTEVNLRKTP
jgi:predicted AAA+ superfamily ATPase